MAIDNPEKLLRQSIKLPSPPAIAIRILEAVKGVDSSSDELSEVISADPALAAKILKLSNSSLYGLSSPVDSIKKAVTIIGINALKNIALSFVIVKELRGHAEGGFDFDFFWKRSLTAAVGADLLSQVASGKSDDLFVTALLQDIGIVVMYLSRGNDYLKVLDERMTSGNPLRATERRIFGFDHQEVSALVLKDWGLPDIICQPIRYHHQPDKASEEFAPRAHMLWLSDKLSSVYHGSHRVEMVQQIRQELADRYQVSEETAQTLIDAVAERSVEILSHFDIPPANMKPFSLILQEANEELGKLNFSYELLVMELKQSMERSEKLAEQLKAANKRLRDMAFCDSLTGLYNYRFFQDAMDRELKRAERYKRPLSLIMIDIDHFKHVNDEHGHQTGDVVLQEVCTEITRNTRNSDIAARYGGEEFTIILPETDIRGAAFMAERVRKSIEKLAIEVDEKTLGVTVSAGVTSYQPGENSGNKLQVIATADKALYLSKNTGRNKITVVK
jgi:diguanylate cyclase (GGDEF)-like protein